MFSCEFCEIFKNTFLENTSVRLLLQLELWNVEFWRLKKLWKPLVFLNVPIKHVQEKQKGK